jgi:hypothetical protein
MLLLKKLKKYFFAGKTSIYWPVCLQWESEAFPPVVMVAVAGFVKLEY